MNMKIVEQALRNYKAPTAEDRTEVQLAIVEVQQVIDNIDPSSYFELEGSMLAGSIFSDVLISMLYPLYERAADTYSKLVGEISGIDKKTFIKVCRNNCDARGFILCQIEEGYQLVDDLWRDNNNVSHFDK